MENKPLLQTEISDPLNILSSTKQVADSFQFVSINEESLENLSQEIIKRFGQGLSNQELGFTVSGDLERDLQTIFVEDAVNFCFWASKGQSKWQIELPDGGKTEGGWFGLQACFERALLEHVPIFEADHLAQLNRTDAEHFFRGVGGVTIPLLDERINNLRETGKILLEKFDGQFSNVVQTANGDAIELVKIIAKNFPSFRDVSQFDGIEVSFLKRAQICANDTIRILKDHHQNMAGLELLTAFADYKLPQILRMFGVLQYEPSLAKRIDIYEEIPHDSREEIEIRAATIWAVELLRQRTPHLTASDIDNTLWLLSQDIQNEAKPYHRTRTIYY